jgi:hypothetical protein
LALARADASRALARRALPALVARSLTLLRAFLLLSAVILAAGAVDAFFSVVRKRPGKLGTRDGEAGAQARAAG